MVHIRNVERNGRVAWLALEGYFEKKSVSNVIKLKMVFFSMKQDREEKAFNFGHRIKAIVGRLGVLGVQTSEDDQCAVMLAGLGDKYANLVTAMDLENGLTLEFLLGKLRTFEDRCDRNGTDASTTALAASSSYKRNQRYSEHKKGLVCHNCGGKGHKVSECSSARTVGANIAGVSPDLEFREEGFDYDY